MKRYFKALHTALGIKRYILGSVVLFLLAVYRALHAWSPDLPALPTWELAIAIVLLLSGWWLLQRVVALETELEPNLEFVFGNGPPFEITEPMNSPGQALRFFRVKVANTSIQDLPNCLVMLDEVRTSDGQIYPNRYVPVGLTTDHQLLQKRKRGVFNLRGKQYKFVVVACLDEKNPNSEIGFLYENDTYFNTIPRGSYFVTLVGYGGGLPIRKQFNLSVDGNGRLRMRAV